MKATLGRLDRFRRNVLRPKLLQFISRYLASKPIPSPHDWSASMSRVLVLRPDRIGDMIVTTGVLRALHHRFPLMKVDVLASPMNAPILQMEPYVSEVTVCNVRKPAEFLRVAFALRRRRYDAVVDTQFEVASLTAMAMIGLIGARFRVGILGRGVDAAFNLPAGRRLENAHVQDRLATMLVAFGERSASACNPTLKLSSVERSAAEHVWGDAPGRPRLLVNVCAGRPARRWPTAKFCQLVRSLSRDFPTAAILIIGMPGSQLCVSRIAASADRASGALPDDIRTVCALVGAADLVVTPDTSVAHVCSALQVPAVALYFRGHVRKWGLRHVGSICLESGDESIESIEVDSVVNAVRAIWDPAVVPHSRVQ